MKAAILLADGFEEIETSAVFDVLKRAGVSVFTAGIKPGCLTGSRGLNVTPDTCLSSLTPVTLDAVVVPGGYPGYVNLANTPGVLAILGQMASAGKHIASICAGPLVLEKAGVIKGRKVTCYPGMEDRLESAVFVPGQVVVDGNIITSRGPGTAIEFALALVKHWVSPEMADRVKEDMVA
ncbi:MAG: DJ-1/PfpI family protein [Dehalococcoidaceae bacterium]|nr:DJ-1/PfpI family protein [Dehalococcoidaceae bacterium]